MSAALFEGFEPPVEPVKIVPKYTEADLLDLLRTKYSRRYMNGAHPVLRYVGAAHVRFGPLWPSSIADFLVQDTWGNYGREHQRHPLLGFEVKVSRSDYLREIKDLGKSAPIREVCAKWYIVAPKDVVRDDLPDGWGLMVPTKTGLRTAKASATNTDPLPMPRGLIAGFLRAVATQHSEASA